MCFVYHRLIGSLHLVYITESGGGSISQHFEYFCIFDFLCYAVKMLSFSIIISIIISLKYIEEPWLFHCIHDIHFV